MTGAELDAIKEAADRREYERRFPSEDQQKAIDAVKAAAKKFSEALNTTPLFSCLMTAMSFPPECRQRLSYPRFP